MPTVFSHEAELFQLIEDHKEEGLQFSFETEEDLNNYEAMGLWIEANGLDEFVTSDEQSLVYLKHPDFEFEVAVNSYGEGDFFSHGISCEVL